MKYQLKNDVASSAGSRLGILRGGRKQEGYPTVFENPSIHALLNLQFWKQDSGDLSSNPSFVPIVPNEQFNPFPIAEIAGSILLCYFSFTF